MGNSNESVIPTARQALKSLNDRIEFTQTYLSALRKMRGDFLIQLEAGAHSVPLAASLLEGDQLGVSFLPQSDLSQESGYTGQEPQLGSEEDGLDDLDSRIELTELRLERLRDFRTERQVSQTRRISPAQRQIEREAAALAGRQQLANNETLHGQNWAK